MRFAQRGGSVPEHSEQQVKFFSGHSCTEIALKISEMVDTFAIRVVTMTAYYDAGSKFHCAIVVFAEESV
jgi:hypothetical protein